MGKPWVTPLLYLDHSCDECVSCIIVLLYNLDLTLYCMIVHICFNQDLLLYHIIAYILYDLDFPLSYEMIANILFNLSFTVYHIIYSTFQSVWHPYSYSFSLDFTVSRIKAHILLQKIKDANKILLMLILV